MSIPLPGQPVRGSTTGAPIMAIFDLLGRRWAMGIVWNLSGGPDSFRGLQDRCESISPSILNQRLKELKEAGLVQRTLDGYELTEMGRRLYALLEPFGAWSLDWAQKMVPEKSAVWKRLRRRK